MNSRIAVAQEQDFLCTVVLNALIPLAKERTLQAVYYILRGRKANQTLQDVHLYSLHPYYRMFPRLSKEEWDKIVSTLFQAGFVQSIESGQGSKKSTFVVTESGIRFARERFESYHLAFWLAPFVQAGLAEQTDAFWQRLHLLVQTVSHLLAGDMSFFPVVSDKRIQQWVKAQLAHPAERARWMEELADELHALWEPLPVDVQALIVAQLSGVSQAGKTIGQLAMQKNESPLFFSLQFRFGLAESIQRLEREPGRFPLLSRLTANGEKGDSRLTESAAATYALVQRGYGKEEIAEMRRIKVSTVEDHLVEIALRCPEWDCSRYLEKDVGAQIVQTSEALQTSRLRLIKDQLGTSVSYLQIRLALAKKQGGR